MVLTDLIENRGISASADFFEIGVALTHNRFPNQKLRRRGMGQLVPALILSAPVVGDSSRMLVAAVMVATLFPTAFADMPSNEEVWSYISLQMAQPDDLDHYVQNPVTLYDDFDPEFVNSISGYGAYERNTTWELKNTAKEGDNCYIRLDLNI